MRPIILWDLDRTLADLHIDIADVRAWKTRLAERFEPRGWDGGWSPMLPSLEAALRAVGADDTERSEVYDTLDAWELDAMTGVTVHDELLGLACQLSRIGVAQAIITNNGRPACERALGEIDARAARLGWTPPRWDGVATRCAELRAKPTADILERAVDEAGRRFDRAVVIGDSPGDIEAAAALGRARLIEVLCVRAEAGALTMTPAVRAEVRAWGMVALADAE